MMVSFQGRSQAIIRRAANLHNGGPCYRMVICFRRAETGAASKPSCSPDGCRGASGPRGIGRNVTNDLRNARKHLEKALSDGYGHRDRAMQAIDHAIQECDEAVAAKR
jgi:hypothetical protein